MLLTYAYAKCNGHHRACSKDAAKVVAVELKESLKVQDLPVLEKSLVKRPQIEGLKIVGEFYIYNHNGYISGFSTDASLWKHHSSAHTKQTPKVTGGMS